MEPKDVKDVEDTPDLTRSNYDATRAMTRG